MLKPNRNIVTFVVLAVVALVVSSGAAWADSLDPTDLQIQCTAPTSCSPGTSLVTTSSTPTFNLFQADGQVSGEVFVAVLVPNGTTSFTTSTGTLTTTLGFGSGQLGDAGNLNEPGMTDYQFNALASASAQAGVTASFFTVYEFDIGLFSTPGGSILVSGLSYGVLPIGSVIVAWVECDANSTGACSNGEIDRTALSESLTTTSGPPPLLFEMPQGGQFAAALLGFGGFLWMRRRNSL